MRKKQLGVSMSGLVVGGVILIGVALLGMKLAPSYIEFLSIKKAVNGLAEEKRNGGTVADIRKGFDLRSQIDGIETVKGSDLEITKDGSDLVISVGYRKEVPLVANMGLYIEFRASSKP